MKRALLGICATIGFLGTASAQRVLHVFSNDLSDDYGEIVQVIGDIDDDGHADVIIRQLSLNRAEVRSGKTGEIIRSHSIVADNPRFGHPHPPIGDLDGDGISDYAITAFGRSGFPGTIRLFSGASGAQLTIISEGEHDERFATAMASDDIDGDGIDDLWISHVGARIWSPYRPGKVHVYSGATFDKLFELIGQGSEFGVAIEALGDIDGDAVPDFAVASNASDQQVEVISGADGSRLRVLESGSPTNSGFGRALAALPDLDGDGKQELLIGSDGWDVSAHDNRGSVMIYSPATNIVLDQWYGVEPEEHLGSFVGWTEANRDPLPEIVVTRWKPSSVSVYSIDGRELYRIAEGDHRRGVVSHGGDIDLDGFPDLVTGGSGFAKAYSALCIDVESYSDGGSGTGGLVPSLDVFGCSFPGETVTVVMREARGAASGALLIGSEASPFEVLGCELGVTPLFAVPFLAGGLEGKPGAGYADIPLRIPPGEQHVGRRVSAQAVIFDVGVPQGLAATNAVTLTTL
ncbi:MAG: hypothetical protein RL885_05815 [Planctomycetota bacterium]